MFSSQKIDKQFILERIGEEEILERYLGIQIEYEKLLCNPLRSDNNPTVTIKRYPNCIWFKDWSGSFQGDCFAIVKLIYNVNYYEACKIIANDFGLTKSDIIHKPRRIEAKEYDIINKKANIQIKKRDWNEYDLSYWNSIGISVTTLKKFLVYPIKILWLNSEIQYRFTVKYKPAYAYYFQEDDFKIYFPYLDKFRFRCNTNKLQGYLQLPYEGEILVITKSYKEVMLLHEYGIPAIAPQSESVILSQDQVNLLEKRFTYIFSNYDFDLTGVRSANKMKKLYGIIPIFLTNGKYCTIDYKAKDLTDYRKLKGKEKTNELISRFVKQLD